MLTCAVLQLVATVARDRVTSPIVPPLIPHLETASSSSADGASISCSSSSTHRGVTVTFEAAEPAANTNKAQPVKPSRSLLRLVWGTATLPVKLMVGPAADGTPTCTHTRVHTEREDVPLTIKLCCLLLAAHWPQGQICHHGM